MKRYFFNLLISFLPSTRFFIFKQKVFRFLCGSIGENTCINQGVKIFGNSRISIGRNSWIGINCIISSSNPGYVEIGKNCDIAPNVMIINGTHEIGDNNRRAGEGKSLNIKIGDGVWIGASSTIHGGAVIGNGSIIASGSVVMKGSFPENVILGGIPAKVIRKFNN
jgi:maltose O-acetyltransferase